ncbi:hypothetical protein AJ79_04571 [Helicocarpus griseus UAMH5409]|uniref:Uncharacterized protein n=1 Tax=Helicocarpus griseus UAMH5409 TaxID=1447875 RepID=A0A2B7XJS9_9EURO|nr:hypothetical protein AJ79_04571 [Helicocarpus griseus UAMH5409]
MQFFSTFVFLLTATVFVTAQDPTPPSYKADLERLEEQLKSFQKMIPTGKTGTITIPAKMELPSVLAKMDDPPESLLQQLATAIPETAFKSLLNPKDRSAMASEFQAGNTPDWFNNLPSSAKSYMSHIKVQATATDMPVNGKGGSTSTSSGLAANAKPTGVVAGGVAVAAGILGFAVAL